MNLYTIDFIDAAGGWYTYDIDGTSLFDAACNLMRMCSDAKISKIIQKY